MAATQQRDLWASIKFGPLSVDLSASGHGYSPDLVHDLLARLNESFTTALRTAVELDIWPDESDSVEFAADDEDEAEEESSE